LGWKSHEKESSKGQVESPRQGNLTKIKKKKLAKKGDKNKPVRTGTTEHPNSVVGLSWG